MFRILIVDDDYEDRDLLKMEINKALSAVEPDLQFFEAASVPKAMEQLSMRIFDLMTLDIEFEKLNTGLDALPQIFETYPLLNIMIISGKLDKSEIMAKLFTFTKDNVLKGKRWVRHFDVLDKKDDKSDAFNRAYQFAVKHSEVPAKVRELFLLAESYLEEDMLDKCLEIYQRLHQLLPEDSESRENLRIIKGGLTFQNASEYLQRGETAIASLVVGHLVEKQLKDLTMRKLGQVFPILNDRHRELMNKGKLRKNKGVFFQQLVHLRNQAIHQPNTLSGEDIDEAIRKLEALDPDFR